MRTVLHYKSENKDRTAQVDVQMRCKVFFSFLNLHS
jgi:hypothetical protein